MLRQKRFRFGEKGPANATVSYDVTYNPEPFTDVRVASPSDGTSYDWGATPLPSAWVPHYKSGGAWVPAPAGTRAILRVPFALANWGTKDSLVYPTSELGLSGLTVAGESGSVSGAYTLPAATSKPSARVFWVELPEPTSGSPLHVTGTFQMGFSGYGRRRFRAVGPGMVDVNYAVDIGAGLATSVADVAQGVADTAKPASGIGAAVVGAVAGGAVGGPLGVLAGAVAVPWLLNRLKG